MLKLELEQSLGEGRNNGLGIGFPVGQRFRNPAHHVDISAYIELEKRVLLHAITVSASTPGISLGNGTTYEQHGITRSILGDLAQAYSHKVACRLAILVGEYGRLAVHNGRQLGKDVGISLGWVRVVTNGKFDNGEAE